MKIYIETYGCTKNKADSEIMTGILLKEHKITSFESADLVILNSCAVKLTTENKILYRITKILETNKKLIVAGCMANTEKDKILKINKTISFIFKFFS